MAFRPLLAKAKGSIVNIASMNATLALPRMSAYCAREGGVVMLTRALALAWADARHPSQCGGARLYRDRDQRRGPSDRAHYQRIADRTAFKRWGQPEERGPRGRVPLHAGVTICELEQVAWSGCTLTG